MKKINIVEAGNELGLGGTEYTMQLYSKYLDKDRFNVTVVALKNGGIRVDVLKKMGLKVLVLNNDMQKFADLLDQTDVLHWHGYGTLDATTFGIVHNHKPPLVIQTNVFGGFTDSPLYNAIDFDLFVSQMTLLRRVSYDGSRYKHLLSKRRVLHNPVDCDEIDLVRPTTAEIKAFKMECGLNDNFVIGRIGREDNAKFDLITLDAFAAFHSYVPESTFLLVGATPEMLAHAEKIGIRSSLVVCETTADFKRLILYYSAIDIFLAASDFGETFGMVIAEAMYVGTPVVTISTPDKDNAQVELVDNGVNGFVGDRSIEYLLDALLALYYDQALRERFSLSGRQKIRNNFRATDIVKSLESLILSYNNGAKVNNHPTKIIAMSNDLLTDYLQRCKDLGVKR